VKVDCSRAEVAQALCTWRKLSMQRSGSDSALRSGGLEQGLGALHTGKHRALRRLCAKAHIGRRSANMQAE
jgi:hypothetical protein